MKLLSVSLARSTWLCHLADFNPRGLNLYPLITPSLVDLYKFKKFPLKDDILNETEGVKYESGEFKTDRGDTIYINLTIYFDGLSVDTGSSTEDSDAFLVDILTRFTVDFSLPFYENIIKNKRYLSQLYVTTGKSFELINPKLKEISGYLSDNVSGFGEVSFETGGISIWSDQIKATNPPAFSIERAITIPFSENRYLSTAALQTDKHIELLDKLESIL